MERWVRMRLGLASGLEGCEGRRRGEGRVGWMALGRSRKRALRLGSGEFWDAMVKAGEGPRLARKPSSSSSESKDTSSPADQGHCDGPAQAGCRPSLMTLM
eukprot:1929981-Rhodomonas_salina.1